MAGSGWQAAIGEAELHFKDSQAYLTCMEHQPVILRAAFVEADGVAGRRPAHVCYELLTPMLLGAR
jgi:hypothetical protein